MSDRKYRHRGYMDNDRNDRNARDDREPRGPKPQSQQPRERNEGPRSPKMMAFGEAVKCSSCGAKAAHSIGLESSCETCKADLHTCRQCTYFDPSARFECSKPITVKIVSKNKRNTCELFVPRTIVERETSSGAPKDARQAFANLFKK